MVGGLYCSSVVSQGSLTGSSCARSFRIGAYALTRLSSSGVERRPRPLSRRRARRTRLRRGGRQPSWSAHHGANLTRRPASNRGFSREASRLRRPRSCGRGGRCVNCTTPGRVAKIVWSRPMPTPSPGRKRVPRWRTMISPPFTSWPAKTLTPRHFGLESRPFRLDPSPFL